MDTTKLKTIAVFLIIFGCFAILYPKLFHPLIVSVVTGGGSAETESSYEPRSGNFPHMHHDSMRRGRRPMSDHPGSSHMKIGSHPGMHAYSEMKKYAGTKQGTGGKGVLGIVLPLYAIGIVIYLVYTLSRLFLRKKNNDLNGGSSSDHDSASYVDADQNISETNVKEKVIKKQKELEKLLWKADQEDIGDEEISLLKKRLIETENQMTRILEAMENIQRTVSSASNISCDYLQQKNLIKQTVEDNCHHGNEEVRDNYKNNDIEKETGKTFMQTTETEGCAEEVINPLEEQSFVNDSVLRKRVHPQNLAQ